MEHPNVHVVHARLRLEGDTTILGIGGELAPNEDSAEPVIRTSHITAEYFLHVLSRLMDAYEAGVFDLKELKERIARARERIRESQEHLKQLEEQMSQRIEVGEIIESAKALAGRVSSGLKELTAEERQALIRLLVSRIEVDAEDVTVVYRIPMRPDGPDGGQKRSQGEAGSQSELPSPKPVLSIASQGPGTWCAKKFGVFGKRGYTATHEKI